MLYKNGMLCDKESYKKCDIRVIDGIIKEIGVDLIPSSNERVEDITDKILMPSIIDLNITLNDKKLTSQAIQDISNLALNSGFSSIALNQNITPKIDNESVVDLIQTKQKYNSNLISINAVASSVSGGKLNDISILIKAGCKAIGYLSKHNENIALKVFEYSELLRVPVLINSENTYLKNYGVMNDGEISAKLGLQGISKVSEYADIAKLLEIAREVDAKILFKNLSTKRSLELIDRAKKDGIDVYSEVSINHLLLDDNSCDNFNTYAKIFPPLRDKENKNHLMQKLKDGSIDTLTSMHSYVSSIKKDLAFDDAMDGVDVMSDYFSLCYTHLVKNGIISLSKLSELLSYNPSKIIKKTETALIKEGYIADLMIVDLYDSYIVQSRSSLYYNWELFGSVKNIT